MLPFLNEKVDSPTAIRKDSALPETDVRRDYSDYRDKKGRIYFIREAAFEDAASHVRHTRFA